MKRIFNYQDESRAIDILVQSFSDVPGVNCLLKDNGNKDKLLRKLLYFCYKEAELNNGAYLTSDRNGVALFYQIQNKKKSFQCLLYKLHIFFRVMGIKKGLEVYKSRKVIDSIRPKTGWYGWFLATDRNCNGIRAYYELKKELFRIADVSGEAIYAETTVERLVNLYISIGFYQYAKIKHPTENFDIWFMKRDPKPYNTE